MSLTNERNQADFDGGHFHRLSVANGYLRPAPPSAVVRLWRKQKLLQWPRQDHIFDGILVWVGVRELPYNDMS